MDVKVKVFARADVVIVAEKNPRTILFPRTEINSVIEITEKYFSMAEHWNKDGKSFSFFLNEKFEEDIKKQFIDELRRNTPLKRLVGGTKWKVSYASAPTFALTLEELKLTQRHLKYGMTREQYIDRILYIQILDLYDDVVRAAYREETAA